MVTLHLHRLFLHWWLQVSKSFKALLADRAARFLLEPCVDALVVETMVAVQDSHEVAVLNSAATDDAVGSDVAHLFGVSKRSQFNFDVLSPWKPRLNSKNTISNVFFIRCFSGKLLRIILVRRHLASFGSIMQVWKC